MTRLCFSANLEYPWSFAYPCVNAIPDLDEITQLLRLKQNADRDNAQQAINELLKRYDVTVPVGAEHVFASKEHAGIEISAVTSAVEWVLDYTVGMYVAYSDFKQSSRLGSGTTNQVLQLLIDRVSALAERQ